MLTMNLIILLLVVGKIDCESIQVSRVQTNSKREESPASPRASTNSSNRVNSEANVRRRSHHHDSSRWGNSHVRRQFKKLEAKFHKKCDELEEVKTDLNQLRTSFDHEKSNAALLIAQMKKELFDEVETRFESQLVDLRNQILNEKRDYAESLLDLYRRIPNDVDQVRSDRDLDQTVVGPRWTDEPTKLFNQGEDNRQMLIIGGISRYDDDDKSTKTKFYRRNDVFTFDPKTASTSKLASLPEVRSHHCAVVFDRKIYVIGGATRFEKALNTGLIKIDDNWEEIAPMTVPRQGLSCSVFRGRIWACGGRSGSIRFDSCEAYHPTEGWRDESSLSEARYLALGLTTGKGLYVIGGTSYRPAGYGQHTIDYLAVSEDRFKPGPEPPTQFRGIFGAAGTVIRDAIFLMGGQNLSQSRTYPTEICVLWPHKNDWELIGRMKSARRGFEASFLNGLLFVIGGNDKIGNEYFDLTDLKPNGPSNITGTNMDISHQAGSHQPLVRSYHAIAAYTP